MIAELTADAVQPMGKPADPTAFGWTTCPACAAVVIDLNKHRATTSC